MQASASGLKTFKEYEILGYIGTNRTGSGP